MAKPLPYELDVADLRVEVDIRDEGAVVRLSGVLDGRSASCADQAFELVRQRKQVTLDLSALRSLDRAGLAPILRLRTIVEARGGLVEIKGAEGSVARVVRLGVGEGPTSPAGGSGPTGLFRSTHRLDPPA